jgi:hypothetical protein
MAPDPLPADLLSHLVGVSRLSRDEAMRLVAEILAYFSEDLEGYVRRRHAELQAEGHPNLLIYRRIARELEARRFPAPLMSERQIRRIIYG